MKAARLHELRGSLAKATDESKAAIYEIRDRIEDLAAKVARVRRLPDDPATIRARIDAAIAQAAADADFFRSPEIEQAGSAVSISMLFDRKFAARPFVALAVIAPQQLSDLLNSGAPTNGVPPDRKVVQLDDLQRQLLAAEIAEELACREMDELSAGHFPRRSEANPAILLAPKSELE